MRRLVMVTAVVASLVSALPVRASQPGGWSAAAETGITIHNDIPGRDERGGRLS